MIADRFNVPLAALIIWNRLDLKALIHPGDRLIIHKKEPELQETDEELKAGNEENL